MESKRLVADRLKRIWSMAEFISHTPGLSRNALAQHFALSERQLQADLHVIRNKMGLPLTRSRGYRFAGNGASSELTLRELPTLFRLLEQAWDSSSLAREAIADVASKLPASFPPTLQPLVRKTMAQFVNGDENPDSHVYACLAEAVVWERPVRLRYAPGDTAGSLTDPIVDPHILMPHGDSWYLIGRCHQRRREVLFLLDTVESVTSDMGDRG